MVVAPDRLCLISRCVWLTPAYRVTNLVLESVPAVRSTRPLGLWRRVRISAAGTPISPIARENWVYEFAGPAAAAVSDGGVCLKTPWQSNRVSRALTQKEQARLHAVAPYQIPQVTSRQVV